MGPIDRRHHRYRWDPRAAVDRVRPAGGRRGGASATADALREPRGRAGHAPGPRARRDGDDHVRRRGASGDRLLGARSARGMRRSRLDRPCARRGAGSASPTGGRCASRRPAPSMAAHSRTVSSAGAARTPTAGSRSTHSPSRSWCRSRRSPTASSASAKANARRADLDFAAGGLPVEAWSPVATMGARRDPPGDPRRSRRRSADRRRRRRRGQRSGLRRRQVRLRRVPAHGRRPRTGQHGSRRPGRPHRGPPLRGVRLPGRAGVLAGRVRQGRFAIRTGQLVVFRRATVSGCGLASSETGPVLLPARPARSTSTCVLRRAAPPVRRARRLRAGVRHRARGRPPRAEPPRADRSGPAAAGARAGARAASCRCASSCRRTASPACGRIRRTQRRLLERGDLEEALNAAAAIGDDRIQERTTGWIAPEAWTHGSSAQRTRWLYRGFRRGEPAACQTFAAKPV